jgi:hypothetical protein
LLQRTGQRVPEQLAALVEDEKFAAVQEVAGGSYGSGALQFHGEGEGLLNDLALEIGLGNDGKMGHGKPPCHELPPRFTISPPHKPCLPETAGAPSS